MDGEARELEALYETRYVSFRNALATVTGSRESARDAVQEAFARALAGREGRRPDCCLAAWVWKIAYRVALEQRRRELRLAAPEPEPHLLKPQRDPELAAALRRLSPRRRLIVFLRYCRRAGARGRRRPGPRAAGQDRPPVRERAAGAAARGTIFRGPQRGHDRTRGQGAGSLGRLERRRRPLARSGSRRRVLHEARARRPRGCRCRVPGTSARQALER